MVWVIFVNIFYCSIHFTCYCFYMDAKEKNRIEMQPQMFLKISYTSWNIVENIFTVNFFWGLLAKDKLTSQMGQICSLFSDLL